MHTVTFRSQQIFSSLKKNGDQANLVGFVKTLSLVLKDPARSEEWKDALAVFLENIQRSVMDTKTSSKLHGLYWMAQRVNREWVDAAHPHVIVHRQT